MAFEIPLDGLLSEESVSEVKILESLLTEENLDLKTHIKSPITFAMLSATIDNLEGLLLEVKSQEVQLPITTKLLKDMIHYLKKFLVSWDRKSREEITKTLQSLRQEKTQTRSFAERLMGMGKSKE